MLRKKIKGGALYIALIICTVIGITLSLFITIGYYNHRKAIAHTGYIQLQFDLKAGENIASSDYFNDETNYRWQLSPFNEDSLRIKKRPWGAYLVVSNEARNRHQYLKQCALYGVPVKADTALLIADRGKITGLTGKIMLTAPSYFPRATYKPVFVEGQSFNSSGALSALLRPAPPQIPSVKNNFIKGIKECISSFDPALDSSVSVLPAELSNNFCARTALYEAQNISLSSFHLSGNIKLRASEKIVIDNTNSTDNILVIASKVIIRKGYKGGIHVIAKDSVIVEEDCLLEYPSSLTVLNSSQGQNLKGIFIGKGSKIFGSVICVNEDEENSTSVSKLFLKLDKDCEVYGLVYSEGYAHLQGKIFGNAICEALMIKTPSAVYENHMMDCEIDPRKYSYSMVVPDIFQGGNKMKCCKWL